MKLHIKVTHRRTDRMPIVADIIIEGEIPPTWQVNTTILNAINSIRAIKRVPLMCNNTSLTIIVTNGSSAMLWLNTTVNDALGQNDEVKLEIHSATQSINNVKLVFDNPTM